MGCGASKGAAEPATTSLPKPPASGPEFDPESKPRQEERNDVVQVRATGSSEAAKRVEDIIKTADVSDFDDERNSKPKPVASLRVTAVPALPSPPKTPPVAAASLPQPTSSDGTRSAGQGAAVSGAMPPPAMQDEAAADAAAYFPVQVALNVGGAGGSRKQSPAQKPQLLQVQQQPAAASSFGAGAGGGEPVRVTSVSEATSLQPFVPSEPPSLAASTTALALAPSVRHPQLPVQREEEPLPLSAIQSQPVAESQPAVRSQQSQRHSRSQLPPSQSHSPPHPQAQEPQSLEDAAGGADLAAGLPPPPPANDPWSSLQSQYRIRNHSAVEEPERAAPVGAVSVRSRAGGTAPDGGKEVLVLGDDDDFSGTKNQMMTSLRSTARGPVNLPPAVAPGAHAKQGGWGDGQMAQAGELMMGGMDDDWLEKDRPPGASPLGGSLAPQHKGSYGSNAEEALDPHERLMRAPLAKGRHADDVQCEDIEDVDALLEDEMDGLSSKSLANKLAAYEAQFGKDD